MNTIWKKLLLLIPIIILIAMLYFVNYTVGLFREITYSFVFDTNVGSVQMLEIELDELSSQGYSQTEHSDLHCIMIHAFNKTLGKKHTVITFLLDEDGIVYHSNDENEEYLAELLKNEYDLVIRTAIDKSGRLTLRGSGKDQLWYYHTVTDGVRAYRLFMSVDRDLLESMLDTDKIVIPIGVIGLLLIITVEDSIWNRTIRSKKKELTQSES